MCFESEASWLKKNQTKVGLRDIHSQDAWRSKPLPLQAKTASLHPTAKERKKAKATLQFFLPTSKEFLMRASHCSPTTSLSSLLQPFRVGKVFSKAATVNEWSTTPKQGNKSTHSRYGHKMFNKISVKDQLEQAPHSTKDAEAKASLHRRLPDLLSIFSNSPLNVLPPHSTPDCHPLPGWERLPNTAKTIIISSIN